MRTSKKSWLLRGLVVFVGLLVVREFGVLDWHYGKTESMSDTLTLWEGNDDFNPPGWSVRVRHADPSIHELPLHTTANSVQKVDAYITKYELTGQYWTPLSKNAVVTFETMVLAPDGSQLGTLEGKIEVEQTGTSSIRRFRQELRDMVEEIVTDRVNDKLRKER